MKEKIFKNELGFFYTIIEIKPLVSIFKLKLEYEANFKYGKNESELKEISLKSLSIDKLIKKVECFLNCEIKENNYLIK